MPGNCAIFRSWETGNLLTASDLTTSFTQVGVTNMTQTCIDDYAVDTNQFRSNADPYPASVVSLPTSGAGELERIRFILKKISGWTQWYAHTEPILIPGVFGAAADFTVADQLVVGSSTVPTDSRVHVTGTFTGSVQTEGVRINPTLNAVAGANAFGLIFAPAFVEAGSGTHGQLTGIYVAPTFTNAAGLTTDIYGINIDMGAVGAIAPTNAVGLRIAGPTGGTTNYALRVASGVTRLDGIVLINNGVESGLSAGDVTMPNSRFLRFLDSGGTYSNQIFISGTSTNDLIVGAGGTTRATFTSGGLLQIGTQLSGNAFKLEVNGQIASVSATGIAGLGGLEASPWTTSRLIWNNFFDAWNASSVNTNLAGIQVYQTASSAGELRFLANVGGGLSHVLTITTGGLFPGSDNTKDLGSAALRWGGGFFSSSLNIGTNPAASGAVRLANTGAIIGRNAANSADKQALAVDSSDRILVGPADATNIRMGGQVRADIDTSSRLVLPVGTDKWAV